jgi:hypothetical protein
MDVSKWPVAALRELFEVRCPATSESAANNATSTPTLPLLAKRQRTNRVVQLPALIHLA